SFTGRLPMKKSIIKKLISLLIVALVAFTATIILAQETPKPVLITNARIYDGKSAALTGPMSVLIMKDGKIYKNTLDLLYQQGNS
ncbi:MAG: hypothetical protein ACRDEA_22665, partial [Microcystaceae cyanobacterium]